MTPRWRPPRPTVDLLSLVAGGPAVADGDTCHGSERGGEESDAGHDVHDVDETVERLDAEGIVDVA